MATRLEQGNQEAMILRPIGFLDEVTTMHNDYKRVPTNVEVFGTLKARHADDMCVYGSYSAPDGDSFGDPSKAVMKTEYAFKDARWPIMGTCTTWDVADKSFPRKSERTEYWLCVRTEAHEDS